MRGGARGNRRILGHSSAAPGSTRILREELPPAGPPGHETHLTDTRGANDPKPEARAGVGPGPLLTAAGPDAVAGLVEGAAGAAHRGQEGARRASLAACPSSARAWVPESGSRANRCLSTSSSDFARPLPRLQSASLERKASRSLGEGARVGTARTQKRTETRKEPGRGKVERVGKAERKRASAATGMMSGRERAKAWEGSSESSRNLWGGEEAIVASGIDW